MCRLTVEDAYAYAKFARLVLDTNDIDFRARTHSDEEADFLASHVVVTGNVKYDGACADRANPRTLALRDLLAISGFGSMCGQGASYAWKSLYHNHRGMRGILCARQSCDLDQNRTRNCTRTAADL